MENKGDVQFMKLALEEAELALLEDQLPIGSVVTVGDTIYGKGRRSAKGNYKLDHAEMKALRQALDRNYNLRAEMTIYTTLEPCVMCFGAILNSKIARVVFAIEDPYGGATHFHPEHMPLRHKIKFPQITNGVLRDDAKNLLRKFFQTTESEFWKNNPDNPLLRICMD